MLGNFLRYLEYEKRYSAHTLLSYETDLKQLESYSIDTFELSDISQAPFAVLRGWVVDLMEKGKSPRTIGRKIATLKSFYKFLMREGYIQKDPTLKLKAPKVKKSLPVFVEEQALARLLDQVEFPGGFSGTRDRLIMELLYGTGIRLNELLELRHDQLNLSQSTLRVIGKGNKERMIPINPQLKQILTSYIELKKLDERGNKTPFVVVTDKYDQSYPMFVYRTVKKYLNLITTVEKKSPHVLRHSFATHLLDKGADLNAIKELLGHSSLAATQVYTHNSLEKLKNVFNQAHPKA